MINIDRDNLTEEEAHERAEHIGLCEHELSLIADAIRAGKNVSPEHIADSLRCFGHVENFPESIILYAADLLDPKPQKPKTRGRPKKQEPNYWRSTPDEDFENLFHADVREAYKELRKKGMKKKDAIDELEKRFQYHFTADTLSHILHPRGAGKNKSE